MAQKKSSSKSCCSPMWCPIFCSQSCPKCFPRFCYSYCPPICSQEHCCAGMWNNCIMGCLFCCCCSVVRGECNCLIYPSPRSSYSNELKNNLYGIAQLDKMLNKYQELVPYMYLQKKQLGDKRCILYFHGNAQDIGNALEFLIPIQEAVPIDVYAVEYPTYGTYTEDSFGCCITKKIKTNAEEFYAKLLSKGYREDNIIIIGRSVGSGGASYIASKKQVSNLILISPFTSVKSLANDFICCIGSCLIQNHYNNLEALQKYNGRLLVIHGQKDNVIPVHHTRQIQRQFLKRQNSSKKIKDQNKKSHKTIQVNKPKHMTHNDFNMKDDIVNPIKKFLGY